MAANNVQTSGVSTLSYTPSSVTDAVLVVVVGSEDVSNNNPITGVDFGATAMTLGDIGEGINGAHSNDCAIYYLANPGTSAATITVNGGERQSIVAMTLDGIDQATPVDVSNGVGYTNETSITTSATTTVDNCLVVSGICTEDTGHSFTFSSATEIADFAGTSQRTGSATSTQASAGTYTHTITVPAGIPATRIGVASVAFQPATGGGATLVLQDASQFSSVDGLALTQSHQLSINDTTQTSVADNLSLTQANTLSVDDSGHVVSVDNVVLSQSASLVVTEALQSSSVDNVALTQSSVLSILDALHAVAIDNLDLVQSSQLVVNGSDQAHTVDNVVLQTAGALSVADALQQVSSGNVVLSQANTLVIDGSSSGQVVDNVVLSSGDLLAVLDAAQAVSVDQVALLQSGVLVVSDSLHAQLVDAISLVLPGSTVVPDSRVCVVENAGRQVVVINSSRTLVVH